MKATATALISTILLLILVIIPCGAQIPAGEWHAVEARHDSTLLEGARATFSFLADGYAEGVFTHGNASGRGKSLVTFSAGLDTIFTRYRLDITVPSGGSSSTNGQLIYEYDLLRCDNATWDTLGQTAIGFGRTPELNKTFVLVRFSGDSVMVLKSPDGKTEITYTYGAARPPHNPVHFRVNMNVQQKLGRFNPQAGDRVLASGDFNGWSTQFVPALTESDVPGVYEYTLDFPGSEVGKTLHYLFVIVRGDGTQLSEAEPKRSFTVQPWGQDLGIACFERKMRTDEVSNLVIAGGATDEWAPAAAYNRTLDQFLVVFVDNGAGEADLRGQLLSGDGNPMQGSFPICQAPGVQTKPAVAFNPKQNEYLVCWQDSRNGNMDIFGARLSSGGEKMPEANTLADSTFAICDQDSAQYAPKVACNYWQNTYLVVWCDYRHVQTTLTSVPATDLFAQRLAGNGTLLATYGSADSKVNYHLTKSTHYADLHPDVDYHGQIAPGYGEWLVVFARAEGMYSKFARIWGVRVKGGNGHLLNTFGAEITRAAALNSNHAGGPPWMPEFPIGYDGISLFSGTPFVQGSPHVSANDAPDTPALGKAAAGPVHKNPECLVAWSDFRAGGDIYGQRVAYFPDSTAFRLQYKPQRGDDSLHTLILLDEEGASVSPYMQWISWPNYAVTADPWYQSWNDLEYDPADGAWLVVWNDWRTSMWDGAWGGASFKVPPADIFGQRLWINPLDSALIWLDHEGGFDASPALNTPIAFLETDEGHSNYPAIAFGGLQNLFLVGYEYVEGDQSVDIVANLYNGVPPGGNTAVQHAVAASLPRAWSLRQNYPNPFNQSTTIEYEISRAGAVHLAVYNLRGEEVAVLHDGQRQPGAYQANWPGVDKQGKMLPSGLYFCRLSAPGISTTQKMVLVR